jgi:hypothetical protein
MRTPPLLLLVPLLAAGCQAPRETQADAEKVAECRARTDQIYRVQDRAENLLATDQRDTPFATSYDPGNVSRGLGHLFGRDKMESNCLKGLGAAAPAAASTGPGFTPDRP